MAEEEGGVMGSGGGVRTKADFGEEGENLEKRNRRLYFPLTGVMQSGV